LDALEYLRKDGDSTVLNVGYGHGYSVRQVLESVERVAGKRLNVKEEPAGPGIRPPWWPRRPYPRRARLEGRDSTTSTRS